MDIKLVIFDLDGVLVSSREFHYHALNKALAEVDDNFVISNQEHLARFDGLSTRKKLEILSTEQGLAVDLHDEIWRRKQALTIECIHQLVKPNVAITQLFKKLVSDGLIIYVCSNAVHETVYTILKGMGLLPYVKKILSNEDVTMPKPHPEIYWQAMTCERVFPKETLIVEDSFVGRTAAISSGAKVCGINQPSDVTIEYIYAELNKPIQPKKWQAKNMNVIIPMAGAGSRFAKVGYTFPKPLIDINNQPMIKVVVDNLNVEANYIFVVQQQHYERYNLKSFLNVIVPGCKIIIADGLTDGPCCTTLLAENLIDNDNPLLIANSDQFIEWESGQFFHTMNAPNVHGGVLTFESTHPKWSYVKTDAMGNIVELREKQVISNIATVGIYYWAKGSDYVKYAKQMIAKENKVHGEYYVAPVYNEAILDGKSIKTSPIEKMWGLGTPEDLEQFLQHYPTKR